MLGIKNSSFFKQNYVVSLIKPYIDSTGKPRLIEPPSNDLKLIQKRIKNLLGRIKVPDNVFSGIKGRSYVDNALIHKGQNLRYLYKIDLAAFFPSISRETVYSFFLKDLCCSPDIAHVLTNLTTVDLSKSNTDLNEVYRFLELKKVKSTNHLISGAPCSQILSYLVNHRMFDELQDLADKNRVTMSIYVDDITFSSEHRISRRFKNSIIRIIKKYKYRVSSKKVKSYSKIYPKLVTGVIIDSKGNLTVKNSLRRKIAIEHNHLRNTPNDNKSRQRLRGLVTAARQVDKLAYPNIYKFAFDDFSGE
jgi:RNA-directed DNA polymerase